MRRITVAFTALGLIASSQAIAYDDRWYISPQVIYNATDSDRDADDEVGYGVALGKPIAERWNLELALRGHELDFDDVDDELDLHELSLDALYLFDRDSQVRPFLAAGLGVLNADGGPVDNELFSANAGAGLFADLTDNLAFRADARYRWDDGYDGENFGDWLIGLGLSYAFGPKPQRAEAAPPPEPAPAPKPAPTPAAPPPKDSDGDGVADARDQCANSTPGAPVDATGCEFDGDNDGIVDARDQCPDTKRGTQVDRNGCDLPRIIELPEVRFANNSAELTDATRRALNNAVQDLEANPGIRVEVAGHTDSVGDAGYNRQLSERRARSVMEYLVSEGIPAENLYVRGYGESDPIADDSTPEGRRQNRRVELRVRD